jgi:hypothetical protein
MLRLPDALLERNLLSWLTPEEALASARIHRRFQRFSLRPAGLALGVNPLSQLLLSRVDLRGLRVLECSVTLPPEAWAQLTCLEQLALHLSRMHCFSDGLSSLSSMPLTDFSLRLSYGFEVDLEPFLAPLPATVRNLKLDAVKVSSDLLPDLPLLRTLVLHGASEVRDLDRLVSRCPHLTRFEFGWQSDSHSHLRHLGRGTRLTVRRTRDLMFTFSAKMRELKALEVAPESLLGLSWAISQNRLRLLRLTPTKICHLSEADHRALLESPLEEAYLSCVRFTRLPQPWFPSSLRDLTLTLCADDAKDCVDLRTLTRLEVCVLDRVGTRAVRFPDNVKRISLEALDGSPDLFARLDLPFELEDLTLAFVSDPDVQTTRKLLSLTRLSVRIGAGMSSCFTLGTLLSALVMPGQLRSLSFNSVTPKSVSTLEKFCAQVVTLWLNLTRLGRAEHLHVVKWVTSLQCLRGLSLTDNYFFGLPPSSKETLTNRLEFLRVNWTQVKPRASVAIEDIVMGDKPSKLQMYEPTL